jgi:hypothetical protein
MKSPLLSCVYHLQEGLKPECEGEGVGVPAIVVHQLQGIPLVTTGVSCLNIIMGYV